MHHLSYYLLKVQTVIWETLQKTSYNPRVNTFSQTVIKNWFSRKGCSEVPQMACDSLPGGNDSMQGALEWREAFRELMVQNRNQTI